MKVVNKFHHKRLQKVFRKFLFWCLGQGIEIHGSTGAPLPEKKIMDGRKKNRRIINKNPGKKKLGPQNANFGP